jgi:hypothetical protein
MTERTKKVSKLFIDIMRIIIMALYFYRFTGLREIYFGYGSTDSERMDRSAILSAKHRKENLPSRQTDL